MRDLAIFSYRAGLSVLFLSFAPSLTRAQSLSFYSVTPCRSIDTRVAQGPALLAGDDRTFQVTGTCNVWGGAEAVSVNVAVVGATAAGNLRLHPCGPVPLTSTINYLAGQTRSNNAVVPLDGGGNLCVYVGQASGTVHFILDVNGYFGAETGGSSDVILNEDFSARTVFPSDNWWNQDVSAAPVDPSSDAFLDWIGRSTSLHPDFGPPPYGIPYVGVGSLQPLVPVQFVSYPGESDAGAPGYPPGYPIPVQARTEAGYIEGNVPGGGSSGDRHLLVIQRDDWLLFETWATRWNSVGGVWNAGSGAAFDMSTNNRRPEGWTSADAAGLAVFPGLVRYDEVAASGAIPHAFRFTIRATNGHVWPASHSAGSTASALPMGARLRLKASVNLSGYPPDVQKIFQAMKTYGLILADNGSDMYITGTMDSRWDNDVLNPAFASLTVDDFEVIELGWK